MLQPVGPVQNLMWTMIDDNLNNLISYSGKIMKMISHQFAWYAHKFFFLLSHFSSLYLCTTCILIFLSTSLSNTNPVTPPIIPLSLTQLDFSFICASGGSILPCVGFYQKKSFLSSPRFFCLYFSSSYFFFFPFAPGPAACTVTGHCPWIFI